MNLSEIAESIDFTEKEIQFLSESRLARLATASPQGQPHVVPIAYEFDGEFLYFSGWNLEKSLKYRNIVHNKRVALVIDDLVTVSPWRPRGIEVRGKAEVIEDDQKLYVRVLPTRKVSWGL